MIYYKESIFQLPSLGLYIFTLTPNIGPSSERNPQGQSGSKMFNFLVQEF